MKKQIVVIDYGIGNVLSVQNAITFLGYNVRITREEKYLKKADLMILPGVGAFEEAMSNLINYSLKNILDELVLILKKPILGICLGMQVMADTSQEKGFHKGLGWIKGDVVKFNLSDDFRVPHVGWNNVKFTERLPIYNKLPEDPYFYFDHSYHCVCKEKINILATTCYGIEITAAIKKNHIWGVQFHPEKSQNNGLKLFRGIIESI